MSSNLSLLDTEKKYRSPKSLLSTAGVAIIIIACGALLQVQQLGQILIILFGLAAILLRIRSSEIFKMAVVAIILIPLSYMAAKTEMAMAFATYSWLLLIIAIVSAMIENWRNASPIQINQSLNEKNPNKR